MIGLDRHLLALTWRTTRRRLIGWILTIATILVGTAAGIVGLYPTAADRAAYAATVGRSAATAALNGRGHDLDTLGGITAYEFGFIASLALPIVAGHLAIHLTRGQEDRGLLDLLTATPVDRRQPLSTAVALVTATIATAGIIGGAGLAAVGLPIGGSLAYALSLALLMWLFAGVGFVAGQVATNGRTAHALLLATVGVTYLARAVIDGRSLDAAWLTPTGWLAEVRPFGPIAWWPLVALAVGGLVATAGARYLAAGRDLGAGLLAARPGPASAPSWVRSVATLTHRLTRGSLLGWCLGAAAWGTAMGLLAPEMRSLVESNPTLVEALGGEGAVIDLLVAMGLLVTALLTAGALLQWVTVVTAEESSGRLAAITAAPVARARWWRWSLVVVSTQAAIVLAVGAGAQAVGMGLAGSGWSPSLLSDGAGYLPPVLVVGLLAAAGHGLRPGGVAVGWVALGWVTVIALLGETLGLPQAVRDTSPFELVGRVPVEPVSAWTVTALAATALGLAIAGQEAFARRDLAT